MLHTVSLGQLGKSLNAPVPRGKNSPLQLLACAGQSTALKLQGCGLSLLRRSGCTVKAFDKNETWCCRASWAALGHHCLCHAGVLGALFVYTRHQRCQAHAMRGGASGACVASRTRVFRRHGVKCQAPVSSLTGRLLYHSRTNGAMHVCLSGSIWSVPAPTPQLSPFLAENSTWSSRIQPNSDPTQSNLHPCLGIRRRELPYLSHCRQLHLHSSPGTPSL